MKITVDVEVQESELAHLPHVIQVLQAVSDQVVTKVATDKTAFLQFLRESIGKSNGTEAVAELSRRLALPALQQDCVEVFCGILFSSERVEKLEPVLPYVAALLRLPETIRGKLKDDIAHRALAFLSTPRRLDSSRDLILPYAETLAAFVRLELVSPKSYLQMLIQMIRLETTRCAGITCLGKLVELGHEKVLERCDPLQLEALRATLSTAQHDDTFLYDVEYIMEPFGWNTQSNQKFMHMSVSKSGLHHTLPIVALAYSGNGQREIVVTSSADGTIATWDHQGTLIESCVLSRHYASSLDLTRQGRAMLVGGVDRQLTTNPAVVFYAEEMGRWLEKGAVEPEGGKVITCVKSTRSTSSSLLFCCGVHGGQTNTLCYYDVTRHHVLRDYHDHTDVITTLYAPPERENLFFSGSRDCSVVMYDLRMPQPTGQQFAHHYSTVSAIDGFGDYIVTGGLDRRVMIHDSRMLMASTPNPVKEFDSAVLSLSVNQQFVCAVSTLTGVHLVGLGQSGLPMCRTDNTNGQTTRYNALAWSANGSVLYGGGDSCSLDMFSP